MLKIGDFSKLSRISIRMLRHYDDIGLLIPANIDSFTSYRYYSETQLPVASRITALKSMGFSLAVVSDILKNYNDSKAFEQYLLIKQTEMQEQAEETDRRLQLLKTTIERLREDGIGMDYNVTLKELPERYVASVRKIIPAYDQEFILWNYLNKETAELHLQPSDPCYTLAIFHDEGYKESDLDIEIQTAVKGTYKNTENVVFKTVAPIQIASAVYQGSYDKITKVNEVVANWMNDNNYEINGTMFCIYHVSPAQTQNPDELVTEVCYPIKKK